MSGMKPSKEALCGRGTMTLEDEAAVREAFKELEAKGLIRDSGYRRDGQICWELTELGKQISPSELEAAEKATKQ